jgi:hypothetical protein
MWLRRVAPAAAGRVSAAAPWRPPNCTGASANNWHMVRDMMASAAAQQRQAQQGRGGEGRGGGGTPAERIALHALRGSWIA